MSGAAIDQVKVAPSPRHGVGVTVLHDVERGSDLGLLWYDYHYHLDDCNAPRDKLRPFRGIVNNGLTYKEERTTPKAAAAECTQVLDCMGISFDDSCDSEPQVCEEDSEREVAFHDQILSIDAAEKGRQTLSKPQRQVVYFPLGCHWLSFPRSDDRTAEQATACWPLYVNHACNASVELSIQDLAENFVVPGVPWAHCVRAVRAVAATDLKRGDEVTVNYEQLPSYMMRFVPGQPSCAEAQAEAEVDAGVEAEAEVEAEVEA